MPRYGKRDSPPALSERERIFCEEYMVDLCATQAAIRAGYSPKSAQKIGWKMLHKGRVAAEIARQMALRSVRTGVTADRVVRELARVAFVNPADVIDMDTATVKPDASPEDLACVAGCKVKTMTGENGTMEEREVRLNDKIKALDMLCKHLGIYKDGRGVFKMPGADGDGDGVETGVVLLPAIMQAPAPPDDGEDGEEDAP